MPSVMNAIDEIHNAITKPSSVFVEDYFYHKTKGYNIIAKVVVNNQKRYVYVKLPKNVNDSRVLKEYWLYKCVMQGGLFDMDVSSLDGLPLVYS
jgi:hypothetical protein